MAKINVQNTEITIVSHNDDDYISLTDMARSQLQEHIIFSWLSLKARLSTLENGKCSTTPILIVPNSVHLEIWRAVITLSYQSRLG